VVLLRRPDKLVEPAVRTEDTAAERRFLKAIRATEEHLAMVFHRFLSGRDRLALKVNGIAVEPWDPFMEEHPATQRLQSEQLALVGRRVTVAPYVLPHASKLSATEHRAAGGNEGWNARQGFYVYRSRRLLVAGGWLGLERMQQEEHFKLARVRIDLDNTLDLEWQIDVRKATARVPGPLRQDLTRIARVARRRAAEAYRFRGKQIARSAERNQRVAFVWEMRAHRGSQSFRVNRQHPVLRALAAGDVACGRAVENALRLVEENLPIESIVMDAREHPDTQRPRPFNDRQADVLAMLRRALRAAVDAGASRDAALHALRFVEPFDSHPEIVQLVTEEAAK
jgi:hypothetical protein